MHRGLQLQGRRVEGRLQWQVRCMVVQLRVKGRHRHWRLQLQARRMVVRFWLHGHRSQARLRLQDLLMHRRLQLHKCRTQLLHARRVHWRLHVSTDIYEPLMMRDRRGAGHRVDIASALVVLRGDSESSTWELPNRSSTTGMQVTPEVLSRTSELQGSGGDEGHSSSTGLQVTPDVLSMTSELQGSGGVEGRSTITD